MCIRSIHQFFLGVVVTTVFGLSITSCKGEESGSLQLSFQLGPAKSDCEEIGIEKVVAVLSKGGEEEYPESNSCDKGEIRFNDVESGEYQLELYGYNAEKVAVKESVSEDVVVKPGETTIIDKPIMLETAPVKLMVRWDFGFSSCEESGVDGFYITAASSGFNLYTDKEVPCNLKSDDDDGYRLIPDEDKALRDDGFSMVTIQPYDDHGERIGGEDDSIVFTFDNPGPGGVVPLTLRCDNTGCEGTGKAD